MNKRRFLALTALLCLTGLALAQTQADQPAKPMRVRISQGLATKNKIHDVQPKYPIEARESGIEGTVLLQATIDTEGKIINLKIIQGHPVLNKAAYDAVSQWRYKPYTINGQPVEVETSIKIEFHMRG